MGASHGHNVDCRDKFVMIHDVLSVLWTSWWYYDLCWKKTSIHDALDHVVADVDLVWGIPEVLISKVMSQRDVSPSALSVELHVV